MILMILLTKNARTREVSVGFEWTIGAKGAKSAKGKKSG